LPEPPGAPERATAYRDLAYVPNGHARQKPDLYVPDGRERLPLIIWVHGGAFRVGSKEDYVPLRYVEAGYAVSSIGYRLSQHAIVPAQIEDAKAAVRWLGAHAGTYHLNTGRFGAWGASAGGHLVVMLGTTGDTTSFETATHDDVSSRVQAVVNHFGPTNFLKMDEQRLPEGQVHNAPNSPEPHLIGGPIQEYPDRVARANPITYVSKGDPPFLRV
jgi:dipeptidyl aminopeptidase/acylaminoacyl peptidase